MCGFAGVFNSSSSSNYLNKQWLDTSLKNMKYRGPDSTQVYLTDNFSLGFNRLSIRDLSNKGMQPFFSKSKKNVLVYNGEIYNCSELIQLSGLNDFNFISKTDTEVFIEVAEKKGLDWLLKHADGIFAFSMININSKTMYLGRDHLGIKPLYIGWNNEKEVFFSSEYNHIVNHPSIKNNKIKRSALHNFFRYGFIQENDGLFEKTLFIPQKHIVTVDSLGEISLKEYDDKSQNKKAINNLNLNEVLFKSVKSQLVSDVNIGTFMSGGVDSSIITSYSNIFLEDLQVITIGVKDENLDESKQAKSIVDSINPKISQTIKIMSSIDVLKAVKQYETAMGEPLSDYSSLMALKACEIAKRKLTVVLSGDGGDELFWGYPRFKNLLSEKYIFRYNKILRLLILIKNKIFGKQNKVSLRDALEYRSWQEFYLSKQGVNDNRYFMRKLFGSKVTFKLPYNFTLLMNKKYFKLPEIIREIEKKIHLQRVLLKMDRASMFHSIELRVPFLSKNVVQYSSTINYEGNFDKKKLRDLMCDNIKLDKSIFNSKKKGFEPPMSDWIKNELKDSIEHIIFKIPPSLKNEIDLIRVKKIWFEHQKGKRDNSNVIWGLYSLFTWLNKNLCYED